MDWDVHVHGHSYPAVTYDGIVPSVLAHIAATASVKASVLGLLEERAQTVDSLALARVAKEREAALARYLNDRDLVALQSTMARLDGEEAEARRPAKTMDRRTTLAYLADLPRLWEETPPERHRPLAEAIFERIEVLGTKEAIVHPTPEAEAHGWRELWGDAVLTSDHRGRYGRGERARTDSLRVKVRIVARGRPSTPGRGGLSRCERSAITMSSRIRREAMGSEEAGAHRSPPPSSPTTLRLRR